MHSEVFHPKRGGTFQHNDNAYNLKILFLLLWQSPEGVFKRDPKKTQQKIMSRLGRVFNSISWKYALGEIFLIFIGITSAIWFNNWNENLKARAIEQQSLEEIQKAVNQDLIDIEENILGFKMRVYLYKKLSKHIKEQLPINDSLRHELNILQGYTYFLSNTGAYETLKSRGLETITNPDVRNQVVLYYDFEHEKIIHNERQHRQHFYEYIKPMTMKYFDISENFIHPLNYEAMIRDQEFIQIIYWALRTDSYLLQLYNELKNKALVLEQGLEKEIARLDTL